MKHITIIIPGGHTNLSSMACIIGAYEILTRANDHWNENGKQALYKIEMAGVSPNTKFMEGLLTLKTENNISAIKKTDLIIIPSLAHDYDKDKKENLALVDWMLKHYHKGTEIASMCNGAFMLASSGLLRYCTVLLFDWYFSEKTDCLLQVPF